MKRKTVAIAGASGMIGTYLSEYLESYEILKINRNDYALKDNEFSEKYGKASILINLAGAPIIRRWTKKNKREIIESRINTTRKIGCIMENDPATERLLISASAIGIYDDDEEHTEISVNWGKGFMTEVVKAWENEALRLESEKTTICRIRIGVVFSKNGGIIARLIPLFRLGLGARIGNGKQFLSWIHIEDLARIVAYLIEGNHGGIYNLTTPGYCTNREFTDKLASSLQKHARLVLPEIILRIIYGQGAGIITGGQAVVPARLVNEGFKFRYPNIEDALADIVK